MEQEEDHLSPLYLRGLPEGLYQVQPPQGPPEDPHWGETVLLQLEGLRLEVCKVRRADAALP